MPKLRNGSKGDSNTGSLDRESGILPVSYRGCRFITSHRVITTNNHSANFKHSPPIIRPPTQLTNPIHPIPIHLSTRSPIHKLIHSIIHPSPHQPIYPLTIHSPTHPQTPNSSTQSPTKLQFVDEYNNLPK